MRNKYKKEIASKLSSIIPKKNQGNRIFTYHSINSLKNSLTSEIYQLEPEIFYEQMKFLLNNNVNFSKITEFDNSKSNFLITFDDGYKNLKNNVIDFLNEKKIHCILFICPEFVKSNSEDYLNKGDLIEITKSKYIEIGSHSYSHAKLTELNDKDLNFQLEYSKKWLEDTISKSITSIAYPYGIFNDRVTKYVKKSNYDYGFTTRFNFYGNLSENFKIPRIDIWDNDNIKTFEQKVNGKWNWMKFFSKY